MSLTAVLTDTASIQQYIFSSNKLKTNIGASQIVKSIYDDEHLIKVLNEVGKGINNWQENPDEVPILTNTDIEWEIGYIGGGNALIFFRDNIKAKQFIKNYSKNLLVKYPGLNTSFGIKDDFDINNFIQNIKELHELLHKSKNKYFPKTTLEKFGFTLDCTESNECAELYDNVMGEYISSVLKTKLDAEKIASEDLNNKFKTILNNFAFPKNFEEISPEKEQSYIAVVHIDGNSMGKRFEACESLSDIRKLSKSITEATEKAFKNTLDILINKVISDKELLEELNISIKRHIVPFRPIIIGGDDITFICHGRLGVFLTKTFIKEFAKQPVSDYKPLSACGGIAIVKSKFPFFKAYQLAEELTSSAKEKSRKIEGSSYVDFHISAGGFSGSWDDIKTNYYDAIEGNAHFGPYRVDSDNDDNSLKKLENKIEELSKKPKNKVLKFREVILRSSEEIEMFISENEEFFYYNKIWDNRETIYFDAIEVMDFYHPELFKI
ncbi:MAG: hypothetical protein PWR20_1544 [Bacteroidales bacterium]|jgi:hypothetical protein|nr:hypothetical protein [Bacteroidales bacterium]MDN5330540.1 hypothetical protein [Bacteroidales bacterium]NPV36993.1 hypothetical protein [Bacteroidales bacterium]